MASTVTQSYKNTHPLADLDCEYCGDRKGVIRTSQSDGRYWICARCYGTCGLCGQIYRHDEYCPANPDVEERERAEIMEAGPSGLSYSQSMAHFSEVL